MTLEPIVDKEVFLLSDDIYVYYVLPIDVELIDFELYVYYDFKGAVAINDLLLLDILQCPFQIVLRRIVYTSYANLLEVRPIWKQYLVRGELEIEYFSR